MEQGSNIAEKEETEEMTIMEVKRMNEWLKTMGMSDKQILDCQNYIATGVGLPIMDQSKEET